MQTNLASTALLLSLSSLAFGDQSLDLPERSAQNAIKILRNRRHQTPLFLVEYNASCLEKYTELVKAENLEAAFGDKSPLGGERNCAAY